MVRGRGILDKLRKKEWHIPNYNFCGPNTQLEDRLARNSEPINRLDQFCKEHDIFYWKNRNLKSRHGADRILAKQAFGRFKAKDSNLKEKLASLLVAGAMKSKTMLGFGKKKRIPKRAARGVVKRKKTGRGISFKKAKKIRGVSKAKQRKGNSMSFKQAVKRARLALRNSNPTSLEHAINIAMDMNKDAKTSIGGRRGKVPSRIIPIPNADGAVGLKTGGFIGAILPILSAASLLGSLGGSVANIVSSIRRANAAKDTLEEKKKLNQKLKSVQIGSGLYLKPYKKGYGLLFKKNCR